MRKIHLFIGICAVSLISCTEVLQVMEEVSNASSTTSAKPTNSEVISGLKEALSLGTNKSVDIMSRLDGFYKNPALFIPFPPEAQKVKDKAIALGLNQQVDKFEMTMNRAAETASKEAGTVFLNAITSMSIADGFTILTGGNNAATNYLREKTTGTLEQKISPITQTAMDKVQLTKYWSPIIDTYNKIPLVQKMNPDLNKYVTGKTIDGIFSMVEKEEKSIRLNPTARVTSLLKKVFGYQG